MIIINWLIPYYEDGDSECNDVDYEVDNDNEYDAGDGYGDGNEVSTGVKVWKSRLLNLSIFKF